MADETAPASLPPKAHGLGIAGMVLGIVGLVFAFIPCVNIVGIILGIVGVILAAVGRSKSPKGHQGMATAGVVCSILAIVIGVIWWYRLANAVNEGVGGFDEFAKQLQQEMQKEMQKGNAE